MQKTRSGCMNKISFFNDTSSQNEMFKYDIKNILSCMCNSIHPMFFPCKLTQVVDNLFTPRVLICLHEIGFIADSIAFMRKPLFNQEIPRSASRSYHAQCFVIIIHAQASACGKSCAIRYQTFWKFFSHKLSVSYVYSFMQYHTLVYFYVLCMLYKLVLINKGILISCIPCIVKSIKDIKRL